MPLATSAVAASDSFRGLLTIQPVATRLRAPAVVDARRGPELADARRVMTATLRANWMLRHTSTASTPTNSPMQDTSTRATSQVRARWGELPTVATPLWNAMPASNMNSDVTKYMVSNAFSLNV